MRNAERTAGKAECASILGSTAVESLSNRCTAKTASIRASHCNFAENRTAFSDTSSLSLFRYFVFENQFSHGLLAATTPLCGFGYWSQQKRRKLLSDACPDSLMDGLEFGSVWRYLQPPGVGLVPFSFN